MPIRSESRLLSDSELRGVVTAICVRLDEGASDFTEFEINCLVELLNRTSDSDSEAVEQVPDPETLYNPPPSPPVAETA